MGCEFSIKWCFGDWGCDVFGIQIVGAGFAIAMLYQTYFNFKRHDLTIREVVVWAMLWSGLLLVTVLPGPFQRITGTLDVARLLDLIVIAGMCVLGVICYQLYVVTRRLRKAIELLVREQALSDLKRPEYRGLVSLRSVSKERAHDVSAPV
jgi:hypothetical protein